MITPQNKKNSRPSTPNFFSLEGEDDLIVTPNHKKRIDPVPLSTRTTCSPFSRSPSSLIQSLVDEESRLQKLRGAHTINVALKLVFNRPCSVIYAFYRFRRLIPEFQSGGITAQIFSSEEDFQPKIDAILAPKPSPKISLDLKNAFIHWHRLTQRKRVQTLRHQLNDAVKKIQTDKYTLNKTVTEWQVRLARYKAEYDQIRLEQNPGQVKSLVRDLADTQAALKKVKSLTENLVAEAKSEAEEQFRQQMDKLKIELDQTRNEANLEKNRLAELNRQNQLLQDKLSEAASHNNNTAFLVQRLEREKYEIEQVAVSILQNELQRGDQQIGRLVKYTSRLFQLASDMEKSRAMKDPFDSKLFNKLVKRHRLNI